MRQMIFIPDFLRLDKGLSSKAYINEKKSDGVLRQSQSVDLLTRHSEFLAGNRCGRGTWREKRYCMRHASCELGRHQPSDWLYPTTDKTLHIVVWISNESAVLEDIFFLSLLIVYNFRVSLVISSANGENERKNLRRESLTRTQSKAATPRFVFLFAVRV